MQFRNDIQGLRALAVLLVFIFHLNSNYLSGGFIGVDVFFVISGYLISRIILAKKEKGTFGFVDFYTGRFKRIVPVFVVFLLLVLIFGLLIYVNSDIRGLRKNIFWSAIFNSNNYLATLDNYFGAGSSENPLLHTWTLSIEMQFYFLLPIFLIFVNRKYLFPLSLFLTTLLISYSYYNSTFLSLKESMYFSLPARIPEFLIGVMFAVKEKNIIYAIGKRQNELSILSLIALILSAIFFSESSNFPGIIVLIPCLATGLMLVCHQSSISRFFSAKPFSHIGELSYSIYLWHWAIMAFFRYYEVQYEFGALDVVYIVLITYTLSYISYSFVEKPLRGKSNRKTVLFIIVTYLILGALLFFMPILKKSSSIPAKFIQPSFGLKSHANTFSEIEYFGDTQKLDNDSIILIGDSHALVYKSFLDTIGKMSNFNFETITNNAYPTIPGIDADDFSELRYRNQYNKLMKIAEPKIRNSKIIFISSVWSDRIKSLPVAFDEFMKKVDKSQKVIILSDFPTLDKNPLRIHRGITENPNRDYNFKVEVKAIPEKIKEIERKYDNLYILEVDYRKYMDKLPFVNDTIAYYDGGHMNVYGMQTLGAQLYKDFLIKFEFIYHN